MRRIAWVWGLGVVVAALCGVVTLRAQEQQASSEKPAAAAMEMPKPGAEMERMKFLVGKWDVNGEYLKTPLTGDGGKQTGWYEERVGPGGFSVIADFEADSPMGQEIGHELFSWDPSSGAYTTATAGNSFPGVLMGKARWEGEDLVTDLDFKMGDTVIHNHAVYSHITDKRIDIEESYQMGEGPMTLMWKATATKK